MGIVDRIGGRRTYLDVNVFIYALEAHAEYLAVVDELFAAIDAGAVRAVSSELSLAEALVKPFMTGRTDLQAVYLQAIAPAPNLHVPTISREVLVEAARLRALQGMRLPDAIHLATARLNACDVFVTNDAGVRPIEGIELIPLSALIAKE